MVCRTDLSNPSQSLIKEITIPEVFKFLTKATSHDCKHEKAAREHYIDMIEKITIISLLMIVVLHQEVIGHIILLIASVVAQEWLKSSAPFVIKRTT